MEGSGSSRGSQVCWPCSLRAEAETPLSLRAPQRPQPRGAAGTAGLAVCLELCPLAPAFPQTASLARPQAGAGGRGAEHAAPGRLGRRLPGTGFREGQSAVSGWGGGAGSGRQGLAFPSLLIPRGPPALSTFSSPSWATQSVSSIHRQGDFRTPAFLLQNGHQGKSETETPGA